MDLHIPRGLPGRQAQFLCLLALRPSLTRADYQRLIRVSHCTAKRDLAQLLAARLILAFGVTRTRRYALNPLAFIPGALADPDLTQNRVGSRLSDPAQVRIDIAALSTHGRGA